LNLSRQSLASVAELLGTLSADSAELLLYKHFGVRLRDIGSGAMARLELLESAPIDQVGNLVSELVREEAAIRAGTSPKYVFDGRFREVQRWLLHDGWLVEGNELVRVGPAAEEATGIRDALLTLLSESNIDSDEGIRSSIKKAAEAFVKEQPDYNASITNVRIALETTARNCARARAAAGGVPYPEDSWGKALAYLRLAGVLSAPEEEMLAKVYTFISPGAHVPTGLSKEEWARLARTFALGACFFVLKTHLATP
jgi:hypothetical protein